MPRALVPRPLVYAHRGGAALRPENTLLAFDHGLSLGADGLELDIHLSADGVVVVHHDPTLDRTTDGRGPVRAHAWAELAALDAGCRFMDPSGSHPFKGRGVRIPQFREVLERYPGVAVIVELKSADPALARAAIDLVRQTSALDRVSLGSFHAGVLRAARAYEPRIRTGAAREETRWALYRSWVRLPLGCTPYSEFQVPERSGRTTIITPAFVAHAHRAGVAVNVWTVDDPRDIERLLDWGVDGIISDRPDVAVPVVARRVRAG